MQHLEVSCAVRPIYIVAVRLQMVNLTIDGAIYLSQHFPFGAAFACQAGNLWTHPRMYTADIVQKRTFIEYLLSYLLTFFLTYLLNLLKPNDIYMCRTAALTSRRYILNIYSTNTHTDYFKHDA